MCYEGRFKDGKVNGHGLITHNSVSNGQTRCEGLFEGNKLVKREPCPESIEKAKKSSIEARKVKLNTSNSKSLSH